MVGRLTFNLVLSRDDFEGVLGFVYDDTGDPYYAWILALRYCNMTSCKSLYGYN